MRVRELVMGSWGRGGVCNGLWNGGREEGQLFVKVGLLGFSIYPTWVYRSACIG